MSQRIPLLVIGPTPPPFHGVAVAVQTLLNSTIVGQFRVLHLELADRRGIQHVNRPDFHDVLLFLRQWSKLLALLIRQRPRVVYLVISQTTVGFIRDSLFMWTAALFDGRVVIHLQGGDFGRWYDSRSRSLKTYVRLVMTLVNRAIVLGESLKPAFAGLVPPERISVVPNGVDWWGGTSSHRRNRGVPHWRVLHLSILNKMKGTLVFLQAVPGVLRRRTDVEFICAGPWSHPDHQREAVDWIAQCDLWSVITMTGEMDARLKRALFESADLFVFPGVQQEGQPLVVLEAMAAGLPILFTDRGCLKETVTDGESGLEVRANDPDHLAERILWMLDHPEEMARLGDNARRRYAAHYTRERYVEQLSRVFTLVAGEPGSKSFESQNSQLTTSS